MYNAITGGPINAPLLVEFGGFAPSVCPFTDATMHKATVITLKNQIIF